MLQSHEYLDLDDNFIIHMIEIKQPTGSGRRCRKLLMKMATNTASKKSVIKYNYSQHLPYFWGGDGHLRCGVCNTAFICETCRGWVSSPDVVHICFRGQMYILPKISGFEPCMLYNQVG